MNRRITRAGIFLMLASLFMLLQQSACGQNVYTVKQRSEVFTPNTSSCVGCNLVGVTENDIDSDSTLQWSVKYTYCAFQAYGNWGECGSVTFLDGVTDIGTYAVCVGAPINVPNNSKQLGTAIFYQGTLTDFLVITNAGDSVNYSPSIIATLVR